MKSIDPRTLDGITRLLQVWLWPPVLVLVLSAAALAQVWLYVVHGLGGGLHDAFYAPGFVLVALALVVFSAGFHELGHAAALRYAGGKPRSFGFGMYLMYPVFFTDVSDNYRLGRWARVRTDLGGFYFNLIVALAIFGLYVLTRQEALLVLILLINVEIIHQLLPLVRLDGYWTLVDLTGIPDFFSQMGAFLRAILPFARKTSGRRLPPLKWWGKAVFVGYIVVTVPALVFLTFLMLRSVPRVLATAWDALGQQAQALVQAASGGDVLGAAGAIGQSLLLLLSVGGVLFSLYRILTGLGGFLWRWSAASRLRRALAGLAAVAFAGLLCALWVPQMPFLWNRPSPLYQPDALKPIGRDERFSIGDAHAGVVVRRTADAELPAWVPGARPRTRVAPAVGRSDSGPGLPPPGGATGASSAGGATGASSLGGATGTSSVGGAQSAVSPSGDQTAPSRPGANLGTASNAAPESIPDRLSSAAGAPSPADRGGASTTDPGGVSPAVGASAASGPQAQGTVTGDAGSAAADPVETAEAVAVRPPGGEAGQVPAAAATVGQVPQTQVPAGQVPAAIATVGGGTSSVRSVLPPPGRAAEIVGAASTVVPAAATAVPGAVSSVRDRATSNAPRGASSAPPVSTAVPAAVATPAPVVATAVSGAATEVTRPATPAVPAVVTAVSGAGAGAATEVATAATPVPTVGTALPQTAATVPTVVKTVVPTVVGTPQPATTSSVPTQAQPLPSTP